MGGAEGNPYVSHPSVQNPPQSSKFTANSTSSLYPQINNQGVQNPDVPMADASGDNQMTASEEHLVTIPGAIVHLVDDQESVLLGSGNFQVVRINQRDQGIVAIVRVGQTLQWPLMSDEQVVKLDPIHYVFSIPVTPSLDHEVAEGAAKPASGGPDGENIHYGVTFSAPGQEESLKALDELLEYYSFFSLPTLVYGDKQKANSEITPADVDTKGASVVPSAVVAGDGEQITEENQKVFWTTMAPNVNDYGNSVAKAIASGTGQIIRGIFWVRDSTVAQLESGSIYMTHGSEPTAKPSELSPSTLRNLERVRGMSKATDDFAKSVLSGVISTVGYVPNAIAKSRAGRAFFRTAPGEVALASMISFWKLFDAVEQASRDVLKSGSAATQHVVTHRYGEPAGIAAEQTLGTAGHLVATAWSVAKLPKALNPVTAVKPSKATIMGLQQPRPST